MINWKVKRVGLGERLRLSLDVDVYFNDFREIRKYFWVIFRALMCFQMFPLIWKDFEYFKDF